MLVVRMENVQVQLLNQYTTPLVSGMVETVIVIKNRASDQSIGTGQARYRDAQGGRAANQTGATAPRQEPGRH